MKLKSYFLRDKLPMFDSSVLSFEEFKVASANFTLNCSTFISLMSLQCRNSSVNHCGFIHPPINLSPRGAAALAMNLNVCWIAMPGLQISTLVIVRRRVMWKGLFLLTLFSRSFVLMLSLDVFHFLHPSIWSSIMETVTCCCFTGVLDLG